MQKNKAIQILKVLTPQEFKDFGRFVHSPYFNTSKEVIQLFTYIKKYYPAFDNKSMEIKTAAKKINSGGAGNEGTLRNTLSALNKLVREFLVIEGFTGTDFRMKSEEINVLENKHIDTSKEIDNYLSEYGEMHYLGESYQMETLRVYNLKAMIAMREGKSAKNTEAYIKRSEIGCLTALDYMIHSITTSITYEFNYNLKYVDLCAEMFRLFDFEKFLKYTKKHSKYIYDIVSIEYYMLKMTLNQDFQESNQKVKEYFLEKLKTPSEYLSHFIVNWKNAFVFRMNFYVHHTEIKESAKMALEIIEIEIENKLYMYKSDRLQVNTFISAVQFAKYAEKAEWIQKFILENEQKLDPRIKDYVINYSKGVYNLVKKDYLEALHYYSKSEQPDPWTFIKIRFDMMLCHIALQNYETAYSLNDTLLRNMERKFKGHTKNWQLDEIKLFRKLLKVSTGSTSAGIEDLEVEIKKAPQRAQLYVLKYLQKLKKM